MRPGLIAFLATLPTTALAQETLFQGFLQGGVSTDTSGMATPFDGSTTVFSGPSLQVAIPGTATVERVFAVVSAKSGGFTATSNDDVLINGMAVGMGSLLHSTTHTRAFELDPVVFGIDGAGLYPYAELGRADVGANGGAGISGTSLIVLYADAAPIRRHVTVVSDDYTSAVRTYTGFPAAGVAPDAVLSILLGWETEAEQTASVTPDGVILTPPNSENRQISRLLAVRNIAFARIGATIPDRLQLCGQ